MLRRQAHASFIHAVDLGMTYGTPKVNWSPLVVLMAISFTCFDVHFFAIKIFGGVRERNDSTFLDRSTCRCRRPDPCHILVLDSQL